MNIILGLYCLYMNVGLHIISIKNVNTAKYIQNMKLHKVCLMLFWLMNKTKTILKQIAFWDLNRFSVSVFSLDGALFGFYGEIYRNWPKYTYIIIQHIFVSSTKTLFNVLVSNSILFLYSFR